jgi:hypothetical protein
MHFTLEQVTRRQQMCLRSCSNVARGGSGRFMLTMMGCSALSVKLQH